MEKEFIESTPQDKNVEKSERTGDLHSSECNSHYNIQSFLTAIFICCGFYVFFAYLHVCKIEAGQDRIIHIYAQQLRRFDVSNDSYAFRDEKKTKELEAFHHEIKSLLELEYNRIQNEYESVEIWTGILTVIFLIFSFYSLFKTEHLENQYKEELNRIKNLSNTGQMKLDLFENESKSKLVGVGEEIVKIKKDFSDKIHDMEKKNRDEALSDFGRKVESARKTLVDEFQKELDQRSIAIKTEYDKKMKEIEEIITLFQENPQGKEYLEYDTDRDTAEYENRLDEEMEVGDNEIERR